MLQALLKPYLVSSIMIVSDAPNRSVIYDHKFMIVKLLWYRPQAFPRKQHYDTQHNDTSIVGTVSSTVKNLSSESSVSVSL
jgi:hypothetical protein